MGDVGNRLGHDVQLCGPICEHLGGQTVYLGTPYDQPGWYGQSDRLGHRGHWYLGGHGAKLVAQRDEQDHLGVGKAVHRYGCCRTAG